MLSCFFVYPLEEALFSSMKKHPRKHCNQGYFMVARTGFTRICIRKSAALRLLSQSPWTAPYSIVRWTISLYARAFSGSNPRILYALKNRTLESAIIECMVAGTGFEPAASGL